MNMNLSKYEIQDLIDRLENGENIPEDYKYKLFPTKQKEYELVYGGKMRKEDVLANEDGVFPVPLQIEKTFNGKREQWEDGWRNMIVFGDNLQFLKTIYENKDPLIKDKVKGKVKLIYIDPPFGTNSDFEGSDGQKAYTDKSKDADFLEFIRRRLIIAREILADDGSIFVHLDWKKAHYVKAILDEVFGEKRLINEIIWAYHGPGSPKMKQFNRKHDTIFWYSKSDNWIFNGEDVRVPYKDPNQSFRKAFDTGDGWDEEDLNELRKKGKLPEDWWEFSVAARLRVNGSERTGYPTEKPNPLLERIIRATTNEGDLVLDFFAGSGSFAFVAEKLNRKWITCDIGKLSFYTIQKRILNISEGKSLIEKGQYNKEAKSFITVNTGHYNLEKIFNLKQSEYSNFVMNLFEVKPINKKISGIKINGERKDGYYALIWPYWDFEDASVDEEYLYNLHSHIGKRVGNRVYIIAPASYVDFISDYFEIDNVRYYFLKVPYHLIKELHKVNFKKFRQPQSKKNINDLEDAIGFHFMKQPEVESEISIKKDKIKLTIKKFQSDFSEDEKGRELENFESLAMVLLDKDFDGQAFDMDEFYFAEDLLPKNKAKNDDEDVSEELRKNKEINLPELSKKECGKSLMLIYVDIFGNEFKERFDLE